MLGVKHQNHILEESTMKRRYSAIVLWVALVSSFSSFCAAQEMQRIGMIESSAAILLSGLTGLCFGFGHVTGGVSGALALIGLFYLLRGGQFE